MVNLLAFIFFALIIEFGVLISFWYLSYKLVSVCFDYPHTLWAENAAKSIASSLSKEQRKVIINSKTCFCRIKYVDGKGNKYSLDEIIFHLVLDSYLLANKTIGFKLCKKRLYKGELCEKFLVYYSFKARYKLEKDIEIQAKLTAKSLAQLRLKIQI